jgi:hypothetical protein
MTNTEVFDVFVAWIRQDPQLPRLLGWQLMEDLDEVTDA